MTLRSRGSVELDKGYVIEGAIDCRVAASANGTLRRVARDVAMSSAEVAIRAHREDLRGIAGCMSDATSNDSTRQRDLAPCAFRFNDNTRPLVRAADVAPAGNCRVMVHGRPPILKPDEPSPAAELGSDHH